MAQRERRRLREQLREGHLPIERATTPSSPFRRRVSFSSSSSFQAFPSSLLSRAVPCIYACRVLDPRRRAACVAHTVAAAGCCLLATGCCWTVTRGDAVDRRHLLRGEPTCCVGDTGYLGYGLRVTDSRGITEGTGYGGRRGNRGTGNTSKYM